MSAVREALLEHIAVAEAVSREMAEQIASYAEMVLETLRGGGRLMLCGNGGSAADAQHIAAELVVRFSTERDALPALALSTDSSVLTAVGNGAGFAHVFARQIQALAQPGDLLVMHSTSGESENLLSACDAARAAGMKSVALLAKGGGRLRERVDLALVVPTQSTARAQEMHITIAHIMCEIVDRAYVT